MMTDLIANMLTIIRNGIQRNKSTVTVKSSNMNKEILRILKREKFIQDYREIEDNKQNQLKIYLKYSDKKKSFLTGLKRASRSGLRVYRGYENMPEVQNGIGIAIISTSQGIMTDQEARNKKVGGEIVCYAW